MAESAADRQRRYRARKKAHEAGDHSLCDASRCRPVTRPVAVVTPEGVTPGPESAVTPPLGDDNDQDGIETVVRAYVDSLGHPAGDPRAILGEVAVRLARRVDRSGALPAAVRELRVLLAQLADNPTGPAGKVDDLRVQRAQRRLDALLANVA